MQQLPNQQMIWNPALWLKYSGVVQWDGWDGPTYQCQACYQRSLTACAPTLPMHSPPTIEPPPGTKCACGTVIREAF